MGIIVVVKGVTKRSDYSLAHISKLKGIARVLVLLRHWARLARKLQLSSRARESGAGLR